METALTALIYVFASFLALIQGIVLWKVARSEKMDLEFLITDDEGYASLARFQLLLFTFVIVVAFLYLTIMGEAFPKVDEGVLLLLGISGASYAVGKGLDKQSPPPKEPENTEKTGANGNKGTTAGAGQPVAGGAE